MKKIRFYIILILVLAISSVFAGNKKDSLQGAYVYIGDKMIIDSADWQYVDTLLYDFHLYDPVNKWSDFPAIGSNIGMAHRNLIFSPSDDIGFDHGFHSFDAYLFTKEKIKYFKVNRSYTEANYASGPLKEQFFDFIHSQNLHKRFNLGIDYRLNYSPSTYYHQMSDNSNFSLSARYNTKDNKYGFVANYIHNRIKIQENGGLIDVDNYETVLKEIPQSKINSQHFNLPYAKVRIKENNFYIKQFYDFVKKDTLPDSLSVKKEYTNRLTHYFQYQKRGYNYYDIPAGNSYYPAIYNDSAITNDSIRFDKIENNIFLSLDNKKYGFQYDVGARHVFNIVSLKRYGNYFGNIFPYYDYKYYNQLIPYVNINKRLNPITNIQVKASFLLTEKDYCNSNYKLEGYYYKKTGAKKDGLLKLSLINGINEAAFSKKFFYSNHLFWNDDFKKEFFLKTGVQYSANNINVGASLNTINNYVYFSEMINPVQVDGAISIFKGFLDKNFRTKTVGFDNKMVYQKQLKGDVINVPEFMTNNKLYVMFNLFKRAIYMQIGVDITWLSSYYPDAYSPYLFDFYRQRDQKSGDYIYTDVFMNCKVKRARFFVKYCHANDGIMSKEYYLIPSYPLLGASIKFGVTWQFYE